MGVVVVSMSIEREAIFSSRMKLLLLSYILFLGYIHLGNASCNVTDRTNVLERAFGPVITSKLEDTCGAIKASFQSGLTEQNERLEEMDTKLENLDTKFENQDEKIKGYIANLVQQFGQLLEAKLQDQKEGFNQKLKEQKLEIMDSIQEKFTSEFDNWSEWGDCSTTCGEGTRIRTRRCLGPYECIGEDSQMEACPNTLTCTRDFGDWHNWSGWTSCSRSCGEGLRMRTRICPGLWRCIGENIE